MSTVVAPSILPTYARQDVTFVRGEGSWLWDDEGRRYLDLFAGIAVVGLGHCHPAPLAAAEAQLRELWHVSNLYWTQPMQALADRLSARFGGARAFFCNSGAEAIEAALKHARKATGKPGVVALDGSFHGRTFGALSVTGQPAKREAFEPLVPGATFVSLNDADALAAAVGADTGAILVEPVQGEGGVHVASTEFLAAARELADAHGALLVLDEVQTGVGRTGTFFAFEQLGAKPDVVTLAKGLANGLPIGALLVADGSPEGLAPGDHASTFGGNPVSSAAAVAVCDTIDDELLADVARKSMLLVEGLAALPGVTAVRGLGLLLAAEIDGDANAVATEALAHGLVVGTAGPTTLRLTPALTASDEELAQGLALLREVLQ
jgi:predicted acetylornithine/succinylornithine family transaminase